LRITSISYSQAIFGARNSHLYTHEDSSVSVFVHSSIITATLVSHDVAYTSTLIGVSEITSQVGDIMNLLKVGSVKSVVILTSDDVHIMASSQSRITAFITLSQAGSDVIFFSKIQSLSVVVRISISLLRIILTW
jgi:hypothetical protein